MDPENRNATELRHVKSRIMLLNVLYAALSISGLFLAVLIFFSLFNNTVSPYVGILIFMAFLLLCVVSPVLTRHTKLYVQSDESLLGSRIAHHVQRQYQACISLVAACAIAFIFIFVAGGFDRLLSKLVIIIMTVIFVWFDFKIVNNCSKLAKGDLSK